MLLTYYQSLTFYLLLSNCSVEVATIFMYHGSPILYYFLENDLGELMLLSLFSVGGDLYKWLNISYIKIILPEFNIPIKGINGPAFIPISSHNRE